MIDPEVLIYRKTAWEIAQELLTPIFEKHGIEQFNLSSGNPFVAGSPVTKVEQHLDAIERVASWLLDTN